MSFKLRELFQEAFRLWYTRSPTSHPTRDNPVYAHFKRIQILLQNIPFNLGFVNYIAKASVGMGNWATVPWIGLRNGLNTSNFQSGLFVVYVLSPDFKRLYLTIIQGVQKLDPRQLECRARIIRKKMQKPEGFVEGIDNGLARIVSLNSPAYKYEKAIVYSKKYDLHNLPDDSTFREDLKDALIAHQSF
jgi:hypothetical protein